MPGGGSLALTSAGAQGGSCVGLQEFSKRQGRKRHASRDPRSGVTSRVALESGHAAQASFRPRQGSRVAARASWSWARARLGHDFIHRRLACLSFYTNKLAGRRRDHA